MAEESWDALVKRHALWLQGFWFIRGVMGTMALVALIPQVTELERLEALRALYALILGWGDLMGWLGRMVGHVPFLPELSARTVTGIVFFLAIPLPGLIGSVREQEKAGGSSVFHLLVGLFFCVLIAMFYAHLLENGVRPDAFAGATSEEMVAGIFAMVFLVVAPLALVRMAILHVPGYRSGLLFTLGVIATVLIGYNIGTTAFSEAVNEVVCAELEIAPEACTPSG